MFKPVVSSDNHVSLLSLLLACALFCGGCAAAVNEAPSLLKIVKESQHPNGLTVGVPEGFEARQSAEGFTVEPSEHKNLEVRYPLIADVLLVRGGEAPDASLFQRKTMGGREIHYRITKSEGGSGGEVYMLSVYEPVQDGHIRYVQTMQSEMGEPDFALCWTLVSSTKYQPKNN